MEEPGSPTMEASLREALKELADADTEKLKRLDLGKHLSFESATPRILESKEIAKRLLRCDISALPEALATDLLGAATAVLAGHRQLLSFDEPIGSDTKPRHAELLRDIKSRNLTFFKESIPLLALGSTSTPDPELTSVVDDARTKAAAIEKTLEKVTQNATALQSLLEEHSRLASESVVSKHARHYMERADSFETAAGRWLWATGLILFATLGSVALWFWSAANQIPESILNSAPDISRFYLIQRIASKIAFASILVTALIWCGRVYKSNKHNAVLNRHRQHALETFQTFVEAQTDPRTREAILLQSTACIFAHQSPGFVDGESDRATLPSTQILEIIKDIGGRK